MASDSKGVLKLRFMVLLLLLLERFCAVLEAKGGDTCCCGIYSNGNFGAEFKATILDKRGVDGDFGMVFLGRAGQASLFAITMDDICGSLCFSRVVDKFLPPLLMI